MQKLTENNAVITKCTNKITSSLLCRFGTQDSSSVEEQLG